MLLLGDEPNVASSSSRVGIVGGNVITEEVEHHDEVATEEVDTITEI
jgi:hypothetical protein